MLRGLVSGMCVGQLGPLETFPAFVQVAHHCTLVVRSLRNLVPARW